MKVLVLFSNWNLAKLFFCMDTEERICTSKDSEDFQPIKKPSFSNKKILINSHRGNSKSLPEMPELVPIEKPNNQTPQSKLKYLQINILIF